MKRACSVLAVIGGAVLLALAQGGLPLAAPAPAAPPRAPATDAAAPAILRVRGAQIVDGAGRVVLLRGVSFGNDVWSNTRLPRRHHAEADYQRVSAMGMNTVRFYMSRGYELMAQPLPELYELEPEDVHMRKAL